MEEAQSLESEIQGAIKKAHEAAKSQAQISSETASHKEPFTYLTSPIVSQGPPNPASPPPPPQSSDNNQVEAGISQSFRQSSPEAIKSAVVWWRRDEI